MKSNDENFVQRLKRQKEDALEFIVDKYFPLVKGVTYKILSPLQNNDGLIEECMNDIFLSIWNHSKKFKGDSTDFKKWIYAVAKFKAIDYYRRAVKKVDFPSEHLEGMVEKSAEEELILMENRLELVELINHLDPLDQQIFLMKFFLGYSSEDISIKFGMTKASIDNRIYRGKKKLHKNAVHLTLRGSSI
ncbi:sigma-70 family RNA polymerase sigma factor [Heyndrickxia sporothermodurans]